MEGDDNYNDIDNDIEQMEQEVKETGVNTGSFNEIDGNLLSNDPVGDDDDDDDEGFMARRLPIAKMKSIRGVNT